MAGETELAGDRVTDRRPREMTGDTKRRPTTQNAPATQSHRGTAGEINQLAFGGRREGTEKNGVNCFQASSDKLVLFVFLYFFG